MSVGTRNGKPRTQLRLAIVDDEPMALEYLKLSLQRIGGVEVVAACKDAAEFMREVARTDPDAVMLDIHLPDESGMEIAKALRRLKAPPLVVFVTGYDDYAIPAFEVAAVDYVMKPFDEKRLEETIRRLLDRMSDGPKSLPEVGKLAIKDRNGYKIVDPDEICFIQLTNRKMNIHTANSVYQCYSSISEIEAKLKGHRFFRANEQCLVNLDRVEEVVYYGSGSYELLLSEPADTFIPLSRSRTRKLREILNF